MRKIHCFTLLLLMISGIHAQQVNDYKYVIIPKKFEALKDTNQYQLNVLTKLLFKESGFTGIYDDEIPDDLQRNNCLGLKANLEEDSGMFSTKIKITLKDCKNNIVFTSAEGKSRQKDYRAAYQEALRNTFKSITALQYKYKPTAVKPVTEPAVQPAANPIAENTAEPAKDLPVKTGVKVLYAQPVTNGFQLVDSTPKVIYIIRKTSLEHFYIIKDRNGVLYKKDQQWVAEYYNGGTRVQEILNVKF